MNSIRASMTILVLGLLAACVEPESGAVQATPSLAVQGCLRDVSNITNNGQVEVIDTLESEAGTQVTVGVGPDMAPWQCIGYSDGTTAGIMSLVDEGAL